MQANHSPAIQRAAIAARIAVFGVLVFIAACGRSQEPAQPPEPDTTQPAAADLLPDDVPLWPELETSNIAQQPETGTVVVEGTLAGAAETFADQLEKTGADNGWTTETRTTNGDITTVIMTKDPGRQLKVTLMQQGPSTQVFLSTRIP